MRKYNWAKYNHGDGVIEVIVRDETGAKLEVFTVNQKDVKGHKRVSLILKEKYGVDFTIYENIKIDKEKGFFDF